jgi:hypothetical protein
MRLQTPVLVLVGFISLAGLGQAVTHTSTNAVPLKHRILAEAKHGGNKEEAKA